MVDGLPSDVYMGTDDLGPVCAARPDWQGLIVTAFSTAEAAAEHFSLSSGRAENADGVEVGWLRTFDAMRDLARYGVTGIWWRDLNVFSRFAVRPDEAGMTFPTLVVQTNERASADQITDIACVSRTGTRTISAGGFVWWSRFDLIDAGWERFVDDDEPLLHWPNGAMLYEILQGNSAELWFGEEPVLGPWGSADGTLAFFTGPSLAKRFHDGYHGRIRKLVSDEEDLEAPLRIVEVADPKARLARLTEPPFPTVVINPGAPRGASAIVQYGAEVTVETVKGRYVLEDGNVLHPRELVDTWPGYGTIRWDGAGTFQQLELGRTFASTAFQRLGHGLGELSDSELAEIAEDFLAQGPVEYVRPADVGIRELRNLFVLGVWNTVTGLRSTETFDGVELAIKYLSVNETEADRPARQGGAHGPWQLGFGGSDDAELEDRTGAAYQHAMLQLLQRDLRTGHRPSTTDNIVSLSNLVLRTMKLEFAGYVGDLAWRLSVDDSQLERLAASEGFPFDVSELQSWLASVEMEPQPEDLALVRERLGEATDLLEPNSRLFLSQAMQDRKNRGGSPVMDYAPVSVGITKAMEVELVALLRRFRDQHPDAAGAHPIVTRNDKVIHDFFTDDHKRPTLGAMPHLLKTVDEGLQRAWTDFVDAVDGGRQIRTKKFRDLLNKTSMHYRNGGAHDSAITQQVCESCLSDLVGENGAPGAIGLIATVKANAQRV